jgi:hypothetical protein
VSVGSQHCGDCLYAQSQWLIEHHVICATIRVGRSDGHLVCMGWFMLGMVGKFLGELMWTSPVQFLPTIQIVHESHANNDYNEARSERHAVMGKLLLQIV